MSVDSTRERSGSGQPRSVPQGHFQHLRSFLRDDRRRHGLLFVMGLVALGAVSVMAYGTYRAQTLPFDIRATTGFQSFRSQPMTELMVAVSRLGYSPWSAPTVLGGCLLVAARLGWRDAAFLGLLTAVQGLSNHLIKTSIGRPRPTQDLVEVLFASPGNSFPSGHVMFYTVFFGFLFFLAWTRLRYTPLALLVMALSAALVLLVGPSRIYLGAHWVSDVMAGYLLGLVFLLFGIEFYVKYVAPRPARPLPPAQG